jgi:hypothetical protein
MSHPRESPASLLDDVRIASPCRASWNDMIGDDRVRFCGQCTKNVYNLSSLPRDEAETLLAQTLSRDETQAGICVRLYRRADGTVLTADCPDGARRKKRRLAIYSAVGGGLMAAGAAAAELFGAATDQGAIPVPPVHDFHQVATMGAVPMPQAPSPPVPVPVPTPAPTGAGGSKHHWTMGVAPRPARDPEELMGKMRIPAVMGEAASVRDSH